MPFLHPPRSFPRACYNHFHQCRFSSRPDPFARRPTKKCDPYGQAGMPLSVEDAEKLINTISDDWKLQMVEGRATSIRREFFHRDFMSGSSFLSHIAAVSQMNDHFPVLHLERRLNQRRKYWSIVSSVSCDTKILQGLSRHDFFLAMLIDVEIERPEVKLFLLDKDE